MGRIKAIGNPIPGGIAEAAGPARHVNENRSVDATTLTDVEQVMDASGISEGERIEVVTILERAKVGAEIIKERYSNRSLNVARELGVHIA